MHYYQRDLRPALSDLVPTNPLDQAPHQHMVTYTLTLSGFNGSLRSNPSPTRMAVPSGLPHTRQGLTRSSELMTYVTPPLMDVVSSSRRAILPHC